MAIAINFFNNDEDAIKEALNKQIELVFVFVDIYMWSLWEYMQKLYKKSDNELYELFDEIFAKNYKKTRENYENDSDTPEFFNMYVINKNKQLEVNKNEN